LYRLFRKFKSNVKTQELLILVVALSAALFFGRAAGEWYQDEGKRSWLVSSVNMLGAGGEAGAANAQDAPSAADRQGIYDFFAGRDENGTASGFFSSPRAGLMVSSGGNFEASYLGLQAPLDTGGVPEQKPEGARDDSLDPGDGDNDGNRGTPQKPDDGAAGYGDPDDGAGGVVGESADGDVTTDGAADAANTGSGAATHAGPVGVKAGLPTGGNGATRYAQPDTEIDLPYMVKVIYFGERYVLQTDSKKVSELFDEYGFALAKDDKVYGAYLDGVIDSDLYIEVKRVTKKTGVEELKIPAKTVYRDSDSLGKGETRVIRNGSDGLKRVEYAIIYEDGVQTGRETIKETVLKEAVSSIIEQGKPSAKPAKSDKSFSYSKVIEVKCTAYTASYEDTGKRPGDPGFGITKSGMVAREGVVAVDPAVIPLGTKMYIEILDDSIKDYGYAVAGDTGSKIKGKKVDLYFDATREQLLEFGVRKARVYILD